MKKILLVIVMISLVYSVNGQDVGERVEIKHNGLTLKGKVRENRYKTKYIRTVIGRVYLEDDYYYYYVRDQKTLTVTMKNGNTQSLQYSIGVKIGM